MFAVFLRRLTLTAFGALLVAAAPLAASADIPGPHPAYIHAMHDLRYARFLLARPSAANVTRPEFAAVAEIDRALFEITRASIDDGKNIDAYAPADAGLDRHGRLRRALELLHGARHDLFVNGESDPAAIGWRNGAFRHIDAAMLDTRRALHNLFADEYFGY
jgi:hypothetical protein